MTDQTYYYTESGLDYVYLVDGFEMVGASGRKKVIIKDLEGLHKAIGRHIATNKETLTGADARFLRHELLMSQATLARLLKVSEQAVHRWENGKTDKVPGPAESLLRLMYLEAIGDLNLLGGQHEKIGVTLQRIANIEDELDGVLSLEDTDGGWKPAKAA